MARGLVSGMVAGGIVGGAMLATASLLAPLSPERQAPLLVPEPNGAPSAPASAPAPAPAAASSGVVVAPAAPAAAASEPDLPNPAPPPPPGEITAPAAEPSAPERGGELATGARDVAGLAPFGAPAPAAAPTPAPEAPPATGAAETAPPLPAVPAPAPVAEPAELAMPATAPEKAAPRAPAATETASLSGAPSAPRPAASEMAPEALSEPAPEPAAVVAPVVVTAPAPAAEAEAPAAPAAAPEAAPAPAPAAEFTAAPTPEPAPAAAPAAPEAARPLAETAAAPALEPEPQPEAEPSGERGLAVEAETALPGDVAVAQARIGRGSGFDDLAPNVRVNRLPTISGPEAAEAAEAAEAPAEEVMPEAEAEADLPALRRFAEPFENAAARPLLSIVLIDIGVEAGGLDLATVRSFPFPLTIAVPADRPGAAEAAATYRQSGIEVVLMASGLPAGARPSDLEVAFEVYRAAIPEAVAVLDPPEGGFQGNRAQAAQAVEILQAAGLGMLALDRGLNAGIQLAERAGLPAALIFRDLDAAGEDPAAIRRMLDRAVFRAGQDGQVVLLARSTPRTVTTLFSWALEGRAESVALAPVSAVLLGM